ncbi:hypothetical protein ACLQ2Q_01085 [Microbacterium sp. DT81.1]|uniref:hypothetical protein n=1 Tax=Actinomycetes TaxID=1760 RepID=UPI003CF6384D
MVSVRSVLVGLALAFTAYLAVRGLLWSPNPLYPIVMIITLGLYLVTTWLCLLVDPPRAEQSEKFDAPHVRGPALLPAWAAGLALANAALVPSSVAVAVGQEAIAKSYATWYIGGIGALMTIVMVRRRPWVAWGGTVLLGIGSALWLGPGDALTLGLVGSVVWVAVAQLLVMSMDRAARDTAKLAELQQAASGWQASQAGRQRERRVRVQLALAVAGPVLTQVVAEGGALDEDERREARIAEGRLRDELRGARLLDDDVRTEIDAARRRGATVTVFDEGGLDDVEDESLAVIRAELADALRQAKSERLIIRTSSHTDVAVTVVGRSVGGQGLTDEDAVDLWREIRRPAA